MKYLVGACCCAQVVGFVVTSRTSNLALDAGRDRTPKHSRCLLAKKSGRNRNHGTPKRLVDELQYLKLDDGGVNDAWRTMDLVEILEQGGVGVLPTESGYGFVTPLESKAGLERILRIKGMHTCKKPLSILCSDLQTVDKYCYGIDRSVFKILKKNFPGPYTFILPASSALPNGVVFDGKGGKHSWVRSTVGIRMPKEPVLRYLQDELLQGIPLLVSSLPHPHEEDDEDVDDYENVYLTCSVDPGDSWCSDVDFVVDVGARPTDGSTVFDLTKSGEPILVREGIGSLELVS